MAEAGVGEYGEGGAVGGRVAARMRLASYAHGGRSPHAGTCVPVVGVLDLPVAAVLGEQLFGPVRSAGTEEMP